MNRLAKRFLVSKEVKCRLDTLSNIIRQENIEQIDLLKIDVERAEFEVLRGIEDQHWSLIRQVVAEVHDTEGHIAIIEGMLRDRGFDEVVTDPEDENMELIGVYNTYARRTG